MQQPVVHRHFRHDKDHRLHHLACHRQLQPVSRRLPRRPHLFQVGLRPLALFRAQGAVCRLPCVLLFIDALRPVILDRRGKNSIVLESLCLEHGQRLGQLSGVPLDGCLLADCVVGLGAVVGLGHLGYHRVPPCVAAAGVLRQVEFLQVPVHIVLAALPDGHAGFCVHIFQPVGSGHFLQQALHRARLSPHRVQLRRRPVRQGRLQLPVAMVGHLFADGLHLLFTLRGQHIGHCLHGRPPPQLAGRCRHARNLAQRHAGVQCQHRPGIPSAQPAQKIEDVLPCSRLLLQVRQVVLHELHAVVAKVLAHRRPQAALITAVGVPYFVRVPDGGRKACVCCRICQRAAHDAAGFFQQHRRRRVPPLFQKASSLDGAIMHHALDLLLQHIPVYRQRIVLLYLRFVVTRQPPARFVDHAFGVVVQQLLQVRDPFAVILSQVLFDQRQRVLADVRHPVGAVCFLDVSFGVLLHVRDHHAAAHDMLAVLAVLHVHIQAHHLRVVDQHRLAVLAFQANVHQLRVLSSKAPQQLLVFLSFQHVPELLHPLLPNLRLPGFAGRQRLAQCLHRAAMPVSAQHVEKAFGVVDGRPVLVVKFRQPPAALFQPAGAALYLPFGQVSKLARALGRPGRQQLVRVLDHRHHCAGQIAQRHQVVQREGIHLQPCHVVALHLIHGVKPALGPPGLGVRLFGKPCALPAFHVGGQACQHLRDAAVLPVCRNAVRAVRRFCLIVQPAFQGLQLGQRLPVVGGAVSQFRHLYGVLQQLGRHMVLVARVQQHPVQLAQVRCDHPPRAVLASGVPRPLGGVPAPGHRGLHSAARVGPRRALFFQPLPVGFAGCPHDPLRLCKALAPCLPRLLVQRVYHSPLDAAAVQVQVLVDALAQHSRHALVGHAFAYRRADDLHGQVGPRFLVAFSKIVLDLRPDALPHLCNAVQLVRRAGDL